jgi:mannose-6-phosphate isomerase
MGTHPNVPATLTLDTSTTLAQHLTSNPQLVSDNVNEKFEVKDGNLPFLFKVLSIGTALSIQAHPDKKLAERLFKDHGDIYKGKCRPPGRVCIQRYISLSWEHVSRASLMYRPKP